MNDSATLVCLRPDEPLPRSMIALPAPPVKRAPKPFPVGVRPIREAYPVLPARISEPPRIAYRSPSPVKAQAPQKIERKPVRAATMFALAAMIAGITTMLILDAGARPAKKTAAPTPTAQQATATR